MSEETAPEEKPREVKFDVNDGPVFFHFLLSLTSYLCVIIAHRRGEVGIKISREQETGSD